MREEREEREAFSDISYIPSCIFIYLHIPSYTFIYLHIPPNTLKSLYIPSYTPIYLKIFNISKMRANIKNKNDHYSGPRASPRVRI